MKVDRKVLFMGIVGVIGIVLLSMLVNSGGSVQEAFKTSNKYSCNILLENLVFEEVKLKSVSCRLVGECFKSLRSLSFGWTDKGKVKFTNSDTLEYSDYELRERQTVEVIKSVCTDDSSLKVDVFDEGKTLLQSQMVSLQ